MRFDPVEFMHLVDGLTLEEVGAATKLMLRLWQFGPMSEAEVRKVCKAHFESVKDLLCDVDGLLSYEFVETARTYGKVRQAQRVEAGKASAAKRNERSTIVQRPFNGRSTDVLSISVSSSNSSSKKEKEKEQEHEIQWPWWVGSNVLKAWEEFKAYRWAEHKAKYKSPTTEQHAVNLLAKYYSKGEECFDGLNLAMAKGWRFPVDPKDLAPKQANGKPVETPSPTAKPWIQ
jgi:hypothetical protein